MIEIVLQQDDDDVALKHAVGLNLVQLEQDVFHEEDKEKVDGRPVERW